MVYIIRWNSPPHVFPGKGMKSAKGDLTPKRFPTTPDVSPIQPTHHHFCKIYGDSQKKTLEIMFEKSHVQMLEVDSPDAERKTTLGGKKAGPVAIKGCSEKANASRCGTTWYHSAKSVSSESHQTNMTCKRVVFIVLVACHVVWQRTYNIEEP